MPYSLVLNLVPLSPIPKTHLSGRHLHALFLDLVRSQDPDLATVLHSQTSKKAFTLSPLQTSLSKLQYPDTLQWSHNRAIPAGTPCWWRITLLDDLLFTQLAHLWLGLSAQQQWQLGGSPLQISRVTGTQQAGQPWASYLSYEQLYAEASDQNRKLHFMLCTPTTFRISEYDASLPTRDRVFKSLLKRWNHYSQIPFPEDIINCIYPGAYNIHSDIAIDSRSKLIGCIGNITFQILGKNISPAAIKQINALAQFSLFAGLGRKTPMGMGQTFYINEQTKKMHVDRNVSPEDRRQAASRPKPKLKAKTT
ncbi:MAG: CRISPR-associated endoribonuclease Cas6 [Cyanobacteria bacterium J06614_10]